VRVSVTGFSYAIVDSRNVLDPIAVRSAGLRYTGIGR